MKSKILITLCGLFLTCSAVAEDAYIPLAINTTVSCTNRQTNSSTDWSLTCNNVNIRGIGFCSVYYSALGHEPLEYIRAGTNYTSGSAKNCWCAMVYPAIISDAFMKTMDTEADCLKNCSKTCAESDFFTDRVNYAFYDATF